MTTQSIYLNACTSAFNQTVLSAAIKSGLTAQICKTIGFALNDLRSRTPGPGKMFVFGAISGLFRTLIGRIVEWGDKNTFNLKGTNKQFYTLAKTCLVFIGTLKCTQLLSTRWGYPVPLNRYVIAIQLVDLAIHSKNRI